MEITTKAGVDIIPSNDFSYYDQVLDLSLLFNAIPERYTKFDLVPIDVLFAMGRGLQRKPLKLKLLLMLLLWKWLNGLILTTIMSDQPFLTLLNSN